jgi:HPt (histidine-containing phosphotransfer) domain-containing protein
MRPFLVRFAELGAVRIREGRRTVEAGADLASLAREMHSMAGEAGLLGMTEVMAFARAAEQAAHALAASPSRGTSDGATDAMSAALDDVETALRNAVRGL